MVTGYTLNYNHLISIAMVEDFLNIIKIGYRRLGKVVGYFRISLVRDTNSRVTDRNFTIIANNNFTRVVASNFIKGMWGKMANSVITNYRMVNYLPRIIIVINSREYHLLA